MQRHGNKNLHLAAKAPALKGRIGQKTEHRIQLRLASLEA